MNQNHNQNQIIVDVGNSPHFQEMPHNVTSRYGFSTVFSKYKGKERDAIVENHLPSSLRSKYHSIVQPIKMGDSNIPYRASRLPTTRLVNFER